LSENILDKLEKLTEESARKRESFLLAITKSSRSISSGATSWFRSEVTLLKKEMQILESVMPKDVQNWEKRLGIISTRFTKAISYLNAVIDRAERGEIASIGEVRPPLAAIEIFEEKEEEKKLNLVSCILEVFDSASDLEKLINEVEKESKRTISTAKLVIQVIQKKSG